MNKEERVRLEVFSKSKLVHIDDFMAIFYNLSLRERCIASIMYFYSMPPKEVLELEMEVAKSFLDKLPDFCKKHFMEYLKINKRSRLLFTSYRAGKLPGSPVERTQVSNAIRRASRSVMLRITPAMLSQSRVIL